MTFAYADPPYPGCAKRHYRDDPSGIPADEVDHAKLIAELNTFDAWALSTHSPGLRAILPLTPDDTRVGSWHKSFASFKPNVNPGYCWEPILFRGARKRARYEPTIPDSVIAPITLMKGTHGAKPPAFCFWLFALIGLQDGDELIDVYPGTGIVSDCFQTWRRQVRMLNL